MTRSGGCTWSVSRLCKISESVNQNSNWNRNDKNNWVIRTLCIVMPALNSPFQLFHATHTFVFSLELCRAWGRELTSLPEVIHRLFVQGSAGMARIRKEWQSLSIQTLRQAAEQRVFQQPPHYQGDVRLLWYAATYTAWVYISTWSASCRWSAMAISSLRCWTILSEDESSFFWRSLDKVHQMQSRLGPWCAERKPIHRLASLPQTQLLPHHILSLLSAVGSKKKKCWNLQMRLVAKDL